MSEVKLEVVEVADVSTSHITEQDDHLLSESCYTDCPLVVYKYEYGYFILCGEEDEIDDLCEAAKIHGFSDSLVNIVKLACMQNAKYVQLDGEGREYNELEVYDW